MNVKQIGIISILFASLMWAIEPIFAKLAYQNNSDFLQTSAIRAIVVMFIALIYLFLTKNVKIKVDKKQITTLIYVAIVGTLFADLLYFYALTQIPTINAVLIAHMQPVFIIIIGYLILKGDKLSKYDIIGISFMMLSGFLVTTKTIDNFINLKFGTFGDFLVLMATIAWATTAIAVKKYIIKLNAGLITFYRFLFSSIFFIFYLGIVNFDIVINIYSILVGIVVGMGTILYYEGLKRLKAAQVSGIELTAPFFAAFLGFFILNESLSSLQIIGTLLLLFGIYFLSKKDEII
jgi:drug/metabolite transporter (DMT)-like permease